MLNEKKMGFEAFVKYAQEHPEALERLKQLDLTVPQQVIDLAAEFGFIFTEQEMEEYGKKAFLQKDELSDEDLEQVAGGFLTLGLAVAGLVVGTVTAVAAAVSETY